MHTTVIIQRICHSATAQATSFVFLKQISVLCHGYVFLGSTIRDPLHAPSVNAHTVPSSTSMHIEKSPTSPESPLWARQDGHSTFLQSSMDSGQHWILTRPEAAVDRWRHESIGHCPSLRVTASLAAAASVTSEWQCRARRPLKFKFCHSGHGDRTWNGHGAPPGPAGGRRAAAAPRRRQWLQGHARSGCPPAASSHCSG